MYVRTKHNNIMCVDVVLFKLFIRGNQMGQFEFKYDRFYSGFTAGVRVTNRGKNRFVIFRRCNHIRIEIIIIMGKNLLKRQL